MKLNEFRVDPDAFWNVCKWAGGDGYDTMTVAMRHGWHPVPAWGAEGRDLGDWPLVVIYARNGDGFELAEYVEGDVTQWTVPTHMVMVTALNALAESHRRSR